MNAKTIEGLKMIEEGLKTVINSLEGETSSAETKATAKKTSPVVTPDEAPVSESVPVTGNLTREQLDGMSYNNLKKLCKDLGIPAVGNRDEITDKILGVEVEVPEEADDAEEAPAPKAKTSKRGKTATPEEVEVDEEDNDPVYAQIVEAVADMETEEIADLLAEVGVSAKGKREALIEKLVQAVKDGLIDFSDEEDEEAEVDETADVPAPSTAKEADEEEEEDDGVNDIENPDMTEERKNAIIAQDKSIRKKFAQGKVKRGELEDFLKKFYDTDEDLSDMSDEDILDTYIDAVCRLIDDDGDLIEEGAYSLNGEYACCGRHLSYVEETGVYICESCGEEYEIEEE